MSKEAFASTIISKLKASIGTSGYTSATPVSANAAIAEGITEYILQNTKVKTSYKGVFPNGLNDPLFFDTFPVIGSCAPVPTSQDFDTWLALLKINIETGFSIATGEKGLVFATLPFNPLVPISVMRDSHLKSIAESNSNDVQQKVWEFICDGILNWLNGTPNPSAVGAATHASSAGVAQVISITVT